MHTQPALLKPLVNGHWSETLDVQDRGLAYGDGVFETMLWYQGRLPHWPNHLKRLQRGCERLGIPFAIDDALAQLELFLGHLAARAAFDKAIIKLIVTRGVGGKGFAPLPANATRPNLILQSLPFAASPWGDRGVELAACQVRLSQNAHLAGIKHLNRLEYVLAANDCAASTDGVVPLLQDTAGQVIESLHQNLFLCRDQQLWTPDLGLCGVEGVLREKLLAQTLIPVHRASLTLDDLMAADEVFICNSVRGIWPVIRFGKRQWPIGEVTLRLQQYLRQNFGGAYA